MNKFWDKVKISDDTTICWEWTGQKNGAGGYGRFREGGKLIQAHRRAWELANDKSIPEGMVIRHSCDNPTCCNPHHLSVGTQKQNMEDKVARKYLNAPQKLNETDVLEIYRLHLTGISGGKLAKQFGVTSMNISCILNGKSWKHLYPQLQAARESSRSQRQNV